MAELAVIKDNKSFTGYSFVSLSDGELPGIPASVFSVALYRGYVRMARENAKLKRILEKRKAKEAEWGKGKPSTSPRVGEAPTTSGSPTITGPT